jgi:hypothetical protein
MEAEISNSKDNIKEIKSELGADIRELKLDLENDDEEIRLRIRKLEERLNQLE